MKTKLIIILCVALIGCGTRKAQVSEQKTNIKEKDSLNAVTEQMATVNTEAEGTTVRNESNTFIVDEFEAKPVDNTKPVNVTLPDGKQYTFTNAVITGKHTAGNSEKKTEQKQEAKTKTVTVDKADIKAGSATEIKQATRLKQSERKSLLTYWQIWVVLAAAGAGVLWFFFVHKKESK